MKELNDIEMKLVDGGFILALSIGFLCYFAWDCTMNPSDAWAQLNRGANSY